MARETTLKPNTICMSRLGNEYGNVGVYVDADGKATLLVEGAAADYGIAIDEAFAIMWIERFGPAKPEQKRREFREPDPA